MLSERPEPLWVATEDDVANSRIAAFRQFVCVTRGLDLRDYAALHAWSIDEVADFWRALSEFFEVDVLSGGTVSLGDGTIRGAQWFNDRSLNFTEQLLSRCGDVGAVIVGVDEVGETSTLTGKELRSQVEGLAGTLSELGVESGDAVMGYVANVPEAIVAFLAAAAIGATWSSVGSDFAAGAAVSRVGQLKPSVLVATAGHWFAGRFHDRRSEIEAIERSIPSIEATIVIGADADKRGWISWKDAVSGSPVSPIPVPFDHPLWVLFTSGTTGPPKGIIHGHGGIFLEMLKQVGLHWDVKEGDRLFWHSSPSWVMWNMQLSALALGATVVCYSGSPNHPGPDRLLKLVDAFDVTFFGTSPAYLQRYIDTHPRTPSLPALRAIGVTGAPISPDLHSEVAERVFGVPVWSVSGGTDVATALCGGSRDAPVWAGQISRPCLGVDLRAWNTQGQNVILGFGEMVVTKPIPSMPIGLWGDPDGSLFRATYLELGADIWQQGDWITITPWQSIVIHGRSDATLNRGGVRMGSADVYAVTDAVPEFLDSLVIGLELVDDGYWMPLFVELAPDATLDKSLVERVKDKIRASVSPRHVPDEIIVVSSIPRTRTGKRLEVPVKRLFQGLELEYAVNLDSVMNPEAMREFSELVSRFGHLSRNPFGNQAT